MKHITLITHGSGGTSGDPALCALLADRFREQYPDIKIRIVVTANNVLGHWRTIDTIVKKDDNIELQLTSLDLIDIDKDKREAIYNDTDAVIFYPTFQMLQDDSKAELQELRKRKPVLYVTNYNFQQRDLYNKNIKIKQHQYEQLFKDNVIIETGIGKQVNSDELLLGINLSQKIDPVVDFDNKDKNTLPEKDQDSFKFIFNIKNDEAFSNAKLEDYYKKSDLYFGYYNNINNQAPSNWCNAPHFVKLAVLDSIKKNKAPKNIDIVIPLQSSNEHSKYSGNNYQNIINNLDLKQVTVELWEKDPESGKLTLQNTDGEGATKVRIISAFPFSKPAMQLMYKLSDPLTMITGNSSLAEAFEYDKIPLYQVMVWHTKLDQDLLNVFTDDSLFDKNHPYRRFHEIIHDQDTNKEERLVELLIKNKKEMQEGAAFFHKYVYENFNLGKNLPKEIVSRVKEQQAKLEEKNIYTPYVEKNKLSNLSYGLLKFKEDMEMIYEDFISSGTVDEQYKNDLLLLSFMKNDIKSSRLLLQQGADPNYVKKIRGLHYNPLYFCMVNRLDLNHLRELQKSKDFDAIASMRIIRNPTKSPFEKIDEHPPMDEDQSEDNEMQELGDAVENMDLTDYSATSFISFVNPKEEEWDDNPKDYGLPYDKLKEGLTPQLVFQMLIDSAKKMGKDPSELFTINEMESFYSTIQDRNLYDFDKIYLDMLITENLYKPGYHKYYDNADNNIVNHFVNNYRYKLTDKLYWSDALRNLSSEYWENSVETNLALTLLETGYDKYKNDKNYLRKLLLEKGIHDKSILEIFLQKYPNNPVVEKIVSELFSKHENEMLHADIKNLVKKINKITFYNENADAIFYSEGGMLSMSGYNYIRKLQLETKIKTAKNLSNVFLSPEEHPKLNMPVYIGEDGEAICVNTMNSIASGKSGEIYLGWRLDTSELCAVKKQKLSDISRSEVVTLKKLNKHIDTYHIDNDEYTIDVQQLAWGNNLKDAKLKEQIIENPKLNIAFHVTKAISEFHKKGFIHGDIKLENILWDPDRKKCTLVDMGAAKEVGNHFEVTDNKPGTILYRAPELLKGGNTYNEATEVYALGVTLVLLYSGNQYYDGMINELNNFLEEKYHNDLSQLPKALIEFFDIGHADFDVKRIIQSMLHIMPSHRPTMSGVLAQLEEIKMKNEVRNEFQQLHNDLTSFMQDLEENQLVSHKKGTKPKMTVSFETSKQKSKLYNKQDANLMELIKIILTERNIDIDKLVRLKEELANMNEKTPIKKFLNAHHLNELRINKLVKLINVQQKSRKTF